MLFDDDADWDNYHPNIIHIGPHHHFPVEYDEEELDDIEFEEFIKPEFNLELEIHNEPRYEINKLDDEGIPQINDDTETIEFKTETNPDDDY
jgi:hypothetical protein